MRVKGPRRLKLRKRPAPGRIVRRCLRCDREFETDSRFLRLCPGCRSAARECWIVI